VREELEENENHDYKESQTLIYGQEIQLKHVYSSRIVSHNPNQLALEKNCLQLE